MSATEEAVEHYRQLAQATPAYLPDLGLGLTNLAIQLDTMDRHEDAEAAWAEVDVLLSSR